MKGTIRVLVAGIGGASLGTELLKCLSAAGGYTVFGCDISNLAFGHFQGDTSETFVVPRDGYTDAVLDLCQGHGIHAVIPGAEEPLILLNGARPEFDRAGVQVICNDPEVILICTDKGRLLRRLEELDIPIPWTIEVESESEDITVPSYPCIIKPGTGSGGSALTFIATTSEELQLFIRIVRAARRKPVVQEYVSHEEGEFTIGVLSAPKGPVIGSIALKRLFHTKLSVSYETKAGLISSGYSQGFIDDFPSLRAQAELIAGDLGSDGPINIQGRVRDGILLPFEINPRFSASTYLRTLAGFNEVDLYLRRVFSRQQSAPPQVRPGYYLRSLTETFVDLQGIGS